MVCWGIVGVFYVISFNGLTIHGKYLNVYMRSGRPVTGGHFFQLFVELP